MMTRRDIPPFAWNTVELHRFWQFIAERHMIFRRRVLDRQPPPWTTNPVLQSVYFTNVYRELDRGTMYVINNLLRLDDPVSSLFNVIAYRAFNQIGTHQALVNAQDWDRQVLMTHGIHHIVNWSLPWARRALLRYKKTGAKVFTGAFLITGTGDWSGKGGKIGLVCENLTKIWRVREHLYGELMEQNTMEDAHQVLTTLPGIGAFMAYELVIDLCYRVPMGTRARDQRSLLRFTEDDWVNVGPGCRRGLTILTGRRLSNLEGQAAIYDLHVAQDQMLADAKAILRGPRMTLRNIEHCLCEYQKYVRSATGGRAKRGYHPFEQYNQDVSPWSNLPAQYR